MNLEFAPTDRAYIRIFKEEKELELWRVRGGEYELAQRWPVANFSGTLGPKLAEGDHQAPEGFYAFGKKALTPNSRFHLSFNIGYPNAFDRAHDRTGSFIMVHGGNRSVGCFAMTDPVIESLYRACESRLNEGQPFIRVHIFPFRMTAERLAREAESQWYPFWVNLKEGYDFFEEKGREPNVEVKEKRYVFE